MDKPFPAYQGTDPYVFVCYAHEDSAVVYPELAWLHEQGLNLWYDEGISAGKNWRAAIGDSLLGASGVLFYISARSLNSDHCNREINLALDESKDVVPVYLEDVELTSDLKVGLNRVQALHRDQNTNYRQHLLNALGQSASYPLTVASPVNRRNRVWRYAGLGLVLTIVIGATWLYSVSRDVATSHSIAVLPFTNLSTDKEIEFFARALSEDVVDRLAEGVLSALEGEPLFVATGPKILPGIYRGQIDVASSTASFQLADSGEDLSDIAEKLGVAYLLVGSVERIGATLNITVRLIRAVDGNQVWSKSYKRAFADVFEMRAGVAEHIAFVAESELSFDIEKRNVSANANFLDTTSVAYELYLAGWDQFRKRMLGERGDWALTEQLLLQAVKADPEFAPAYELLAFAYRSRLGGSMSLSEASLKAHAAISRAIALNPDPIYYMQVKQLGQIYFFLDLDYEKAEATFRRCVDRFPRIWVCHAQLARIAMHEGKTKEEVSRLWATASALDAGIERLSFLTMHAMDLFIAGDYERALEVSLEGSNLALDGQLRTNNLLLQMIALILLEHDDAKRSLEEAYEWGGRVVPEVFIYAFARIGEREKAEQILSKSGHEGDKFWLAVGYLELGYVDNAFKAIEAGIEDHQYEIVASLRTAEWWNPIRDDPRFDDMLELLDSKVTHTQTYLNNLDAAGR